MQTKELPFSLIKKDTCPKPEEFLRFWLPWGAPNATNKQETNKGTMLAP